MAEIDASLPAKVAPPQFDPLATIGKIQSVKTGMLNNQLLGLQVQGKQALGQIIGAHTDAQTGETDWNAVSADASKNPQAAIMLPELQGQVLQRKLADIQVHREGLGLSNDQWGKIGAVSMGLLGAKGKDGKPQPLTRDDVISSLSQNLVGSGMFSDPKSIGMLTNFVQHLPDDPEKIRQALQGVAIMSSPTTERLQAVNGAVNSTDVGPGVAITQTSPLTGQTSTSAVLDKSLSPSERNTPAYTYTDDKGVQHIVTKAQAAASEGSTTAPAGVTSGLPIGSEQTAAANVQQAQALQQRAAIVPQRKAALKNMVDQVGDFLPGPKADLTYATGALATMLGKAPPSVVKGVAAQEEFNKLAAQVALDQFSALGGTGANDQLAASMKANPNATLSRMGIKNVAALLQGNEDAIGAQFDAWKKYSTVHGPSSYGDFLAGWNKYYDPRVFQAQHMEPGAVKVMLQKMTPDERKTFERDKSIAQQAGWLGGQ